MVALITLFLGIAIGLLLTVAVSLYLIRVKCPKCKQPKPLHQIILFNWKARQITGQPCLKCRQIKPQIDIF